MFSIRHHNRGALAKPVAYTILESTVIGLIGYNRV